MVEDDSKSDGGTGSGVYLDGMVISYELLFDKELLRSAIHCSQNLLKAWKIIRTKLLQELRGDLKKR